MKKNFNILDCTLRDGGYYTNWDFDKSIVKSYLECINDLPIKYIEVGYKGCYQSEYKGQYFFLPNSTLKFISNCTTKDLAIMLDAKDVKVDGNFKQSMIEVKNYISLVRIATTPSKIEKSLEIASVLKDSGFEVALNVMNISSIYNEQLFFSFLKDIESKIDYLYLVDSYGSIFPEELKKIILKLRKHTSVSLGFHSHNNIELSFSNTLAAIECGVELIDSTVLGMGRGAGNLKTELILSYLKSQKNLEVDLNLLGRLVEIFQPLHNKYRWGTNLAYIVAGLFSIPQGNVMKMLEINRYSLAGVLKRLQKNTITSFPCFKNKDKVKKCVIIGGGESILLHFEAIEAYLLLDPDITIIHSSSRYIGLFKNLPNKSILAIPGDQVLNINSFLEFADACILASAPREINIASYDFNKVFELNDTHFPKYKDSPLSISLDVAIELMAEDVRLIGFDGYSELKNTKQIFLMQENQSIIDIFTENRELLSLTPSGYRNLIHGSIYEEIA